MATPQRLAEPCFRGNFDIGATSPRLFPGARRLSLVHHRGLQALPRLLNRRQIKPPVTAGVGRRKGSAPAGPDLAQKFPSAAPPSATSLSGRFWDSGWISVNSHSLATSNKIDDGLRQAHGLKQLVPPGNSGCIRRHLLKYQLWLGALILAGEIPQGYTPTLHLGGNS